MEVRFGQQALSRLEREGGDGGYPSGVVRAFRKRLALIRASPDERDFYALKSLHFERLKGDRRHQRSMRLNDKYRLILELKSDGGQRVVEIVGIEDYH